MRADAVEQQHADGPSGYSAMTLTDSGISTGVSTPVSGCGRCAVQVRLTAVTRRMGPNQRSSTSK